MSATDKTDHAIVIAEADDQARAWLERCLDGRFRVHIVTSARELLARVESGDIGPGVLIVGQRLEDAPVDQVLAHLAEHADALADARVALFLGNRPGENRDELPEGLSVHYTLDPRLATEDVIALIERALVSVGRAPENAIDVRGAERITRVLDMARALSRHTELDAFAGAIERGMIALGCADRGYCLFHDADSGILWSESESERKDQELGAFAGLAGFAARVGRPAFAPRAADDPRYHREVDDPDGNGSESILAVPIVDPDGSVHAVLVAIRSIRPHTDDERARVEELARHTGPIVHQLALRSEALSALEERGDRPAEDLFRREAIDAYVSRGRRGDVVRVMPPWIRWAYWLLLVLLVLGSVYLVVGRVDEYSVGHAVVQMSGRRDITAHAPGKVESVVVEDGDWVDAGQTLVSLYGAEERATLDRLEREFATRVRARMLDLDDPAAEQAASALRSEIERARADLEERFIRAPSAGTVTKVDAQVGQQLGPGDLVASLQADDTELSIIALMPGSDRPKLEPGMRIRVELAGYRYAYQDLTIDKVSDNIIGPNEARRYLGKRIGDGVAITGPVVVVEARLPERSFESQGTEYRFHDGMQGVAEVRTRSRRIIVALIPQLEELQ